ncbi:hypothetical protein B0H14DRAFT_3511936 [Mycena olivaceomarginata]|nr:hypothetical protein B0H14DRAFT_3511936 [Mycena olivaceomarginata]
MAWALVGYNARFKLLNIVAKPPSNTPFVTKNVQRGSRYITLGLLSAALVIYTVNRQRPSHKLSRVECAIEVCEETLKYATSNCARNHLELTDTTRRLLEAKLSASKIETQLLETHSVTTWEGLVEYLQNLRDIVQNINQCAKDVKGIQRSILLTIEAERQRQFFEGIKELREIHDTVTSASACRRGRPATTTTTEEFQPGSLPYAAPELLGPPPLTSSTSMTGKTKAAAIAGKSNSAFVSHPKSSSATPIAHSKNPAPAQDIWALGVLLYALLMGRLPFVDSFEPRLVLKILGGDFVLMLIPTGCIAVVLISFISLALPPPGPPPLLPLRLSNLTLTTNPTGTYTPPTNVNARTLAILHGCLAPRVADRWVVERVDEAAWCVGGAEASPCDSCNDSGDDEQLEIAGAAHAVSTRPCSSPWEGGSAPWIGAACGGEAGGALVVARAV